MTEQDIDQLDHSEAYHTMSMSNLGLLINHTDQLPVDMKTQAVCRIFFLAHSLIMGMKPEEGWCPLYFDGVLCWPSKPANSTISVSCPGEIQGISYRTEYNVTRHCNSNGTWDKANYSGCVALVHEPVTPIPWLHLKIMYCMYWIGYTASLIFLATALAIFARYQKLWCLRNIIHSNLILCFTLHNVTWIVYSLVANEILTKVYGLEEMDYCYLPTILLKYFIAAGFFWMFVEGVYLFISVIFSFHTRRIRFWMCAIVGWVVPLLLIILTTIAKSQDYETGECWNEQYHLDYIFIGPVLCILLVNLAFLLIIMYVVVTKLQVTVPVEATRYKKAIKALFILCPLLGVNYIFVLVQPNNPLWAKLIFSYYFTTMTSCQGFLVALLFCFRNNEVWLIIKRSVRRWRRVMKLSSQSTLRESLRSDTPSMMVDFESSPGRTVRHTVQNGKHKHGQQNGKMRNVIVMNDDGEFRLFLPQYPSRPQTNDTGKDQQTACRKHSCPAFRKGSSVSWTNALGRHPTADQVGCKRNGNRLVRCAASVDENQQTKIGQ